MGLNAPYSNLESLPPSVEKVETLAVLRQAILTSGALAELKGIAKIIPNQAILINAVVLQEAKDSSEIENIITTQDELYEAVASTKVILSKETKEVINYREALFFGFQLVQNQGFLTLNNIIKIQEILVGNQAGIRNLPGTVLKNESTGEVVYMPPQNRIEIDELLSNFIENYNQSNHIAPLINMAILHFQFESIHPFYDGNGRTGRILNILYLFINGLIDVPILYLSSYISKNKPEYYKLLNQTNHKGLWEDWIIYMLKGIEVTSRNTISKIEDIKDLLELTLNNVREKAPKIYRKDLVELLFEHPYSKIEYVINKLQVERKAASRYLKELEKIGVLKSKKIGRETLYINHRLFEVLRKVD